MLLLLPRGTTTMRLLAHAKRPHAVEIMFAQLPRSNGRNPKAAIYRVHKHGSPPGLGLSSGYAMTALAACAPLSKH